MTKKQVSLSMKTENVERVLSFTPGRRNGKNERVLSFTPGRRNGKNKRVLHVTLGCKNNKTKIKVGKFIKLV